MRAFSVAACFAAAASVVSADRLIVEHDCWLYNICQMKSAKWHTDHGVFDVNGNDGCSSWGPPHIREICVDWAMGRVHFYFNGQGKRCLRKQADYAIDCAWPGKCVRAEFNEVPCDW